MTHKYEKKIFYKDARAPAADVAARERERDLHVDDRTEVQKWLPTRDRKGETLENYEDR